MWVRMRESKVSAEAGATACFDVVNDLPTLLSRFQRKQYADIDIVKTEKKGFGVRANVDLPT